MVTVAAVPVRFLRGRRNRPLLPHRLLAPLREQLLAMSDLARGIADDLDDDRWRRAADALDAAAAALRALL